MTKEQIIDSVAEVYELLADEAESDYEADLETMYSATLIWKNTVENLNSAE